MSRDIPLRRPPLLFLAGPPLLAAAKLRIAQWGARARNPQSIQLSILRAHCRTAAQTEFGRQHRLGEVQTYRDFCERVPPRTYADYDPLFQRMRRGERDVLWPGLIPYFCQSSGTSGTAAGVKHLPVSFQQIANQQRAGADLLARYLDMSGDYSLVGGYSLSCWPPGIITREGEVGISNNLGVMSHHLPRFARLCSLPDPAIRDIDDCEAKLSAMAAAYLDYDVRSLSGTTCWFTLLFDRLLAEARRRGRAARHVTDIWPNLAVLFGGGVQADPYRPILAARIGRPVVFIDNYNATEGGILAATDPAGQGSLLPLLDRGVFFEFIPRSQIGQPNPTRLPLWQVECNTDYSVVLTTASGLFAYQIGDFVRFTSTFPHRLVFAGRERGVLSLVQELTTSLELERAVLSGVREQPCTIREFGCSTEVRSDGDGRGRYLFFIEFEKPPEDLAAFAVAVDRGLGAENRVYQTHRQGDVAILAPQVIPLQPGTSAQVMRALNIHSPQQKFPRILDASKLAVLRGLFTEFQDAARLRVDSDLHPSRP